MQSSLANSTESSTKLLHAAAARGILPRIQLRAEIMGQVIQRLNHRHEQILNWLLLNPHKTLGECAAFFGYTQAWLSTLIHSDMFQAELRRRNSQVFMRVADSIPEKLKTLADVAAEKLVTMVEKSEDPDFVLNSFDKVMHRLGYAPKTAVSEKASVTNVQVNNTFAVSRETLAVARAHITGSRPAGADSAALPAEDVIATPLPAPQKMEAAE